VSPLDSYSPSRSPSIDFALSSLHIDSPLGVSRMSFGSGLKIGADKSACTVKPRRSRATDCGIG
jgi:hypothetical protein